MTLRFVARFVAVSAVAAVAVGAAGCGPQWPGDPAAYRPVAVGESAVADSGVAVERYRQVFGEAGDCPVAVQVPVEGAPDDSADAIPAAVIVVCRVPDADSAAAVRAVAVRNSDESADTELAGETVESVRSPLPGGGSGLEIRIWTPGDAIMVVVLGLDGAAAADKAMEAVIGVARSAG